MKTLFTLILICASSILMAQNQSSFPVGVDKSEPCLGNSNPSKFNYPRYGAPKNMPIWEENFENPANWIPEGPEDATGEEYGWSIGDTTNSWYLPLEVTMGTSGSFARFKNGTNNDYFSGGPFTLTYTETIDLSEVENPFLEFHQYGARFRTLQAVQISMDGTTWLTISDNNDLPMTTSFAQHIYPKPMLRRIRLAPFLSGDLSEVHIRLFWDGMMNGTNMNYMDYGWFVDDIKIRPGYEHDLELNYTTTHFMGEYGHAYSVVPFQANSQFIHFNAKVTNNGNNTEDVYLNVTNGGPYNQNSATTSISPGQSTILSISGNQAFPMYHNPTSFIFQAKSSDSLDYENDDFGNYSYSRSGFDGENMAVDRFTGEANTLTGAFSGWSDGSDIQGIGSFFELLGGFYGAVGSVGIGIANVPESQQHLYIGNAVYAEVWGTNGVDITFFGSTISHNIQAADFGTMIQLGAINAEQCISTSGNRIFVLACFQADAQVPIAYSGQTQFETVLGRNNSEFYLLAATHQGSMFVNAPVVRPYFMCPLSSPNINLETPNVEIYPNPASESANVQMTLNGEEDVIIVVRDLAGKTIQTINAGKLTAGAHDIAMNLEGVAQGMYTVTISAGINYVTQKLIIE